MNREQKSSSCSRNVLSTGDSIVTTLGRETGGRIDLTRFSSDCLPPRALVRNDVDSRPYTRLYTLVSPCDRVARVGLSDLGLGQV